MRASLLLNVLAAVVVLAVLLGGPGREHGTALELTGANGALALSNSKAGTAILGGDRLRPGVPVSGTVTLGNAGGDASLALEAAAESETAGAGGGRLWNRLRITVATGGSVVYDGRVADMGRLALGSLPAGAARAYAFTAVLPGGTGDDYQGARLSLGFTWLGQAEGGAAAPTPTPTPTPVPPTATPTAPPSAPAPVPTPAPPAAAADPNTTVTATGVISLPKTCLSRRRLTVHVHPPRGVRVKSVTAYVNGKRKATAKTGAAKIDLRGLPKGTVTVKIKAKLANGRTLTLSRAYRTCARRR